MSWFEEGLKELGLNKESYDELSESDQTAVKELLREMGHI